MEQDNSELVPFGQSCYLITQFGRSELAGKSVGIAKNERALLFTNF